MSGHKEAHCRVANAPKNSYVKRPRRFGFQDQTRDTDKRKRFEHVDTTLLLETTETTPHPSEFSAGRQRPLQKLSGNDEAAPQKRSGFRVLPDCLLHLGNTTAWRKVSAHLAAQPHRDTVSEAVAVASAMPMSQLSKQSA